MASAATMRPQHAIIDLTVDESPPHSARSTSGSRRPERINNGSSHRLSVARGSPLTDIIDVDALPDVPDQRWHQRISSSPDIEVTYSRPAPNPRAFPSFYFERPRPEPLEPIYMYEQMPQRRDEASLPEIGRRTRIWADEIDRMRVHHRQTLRRALDRDGAFNDGYLGNAELHMHVAELRRFHASPRPQPAANPVNTNNDDDIIILPKFDPPPAPRAGFTRAPRPADLLVCPNCDDELSVGDSERKRAVWVVKSCGHVSRHPDIQLQI
jgi:hypothetical protein